VITGAFAIRVFFFIFAPHFNEYEPRPAEVTSESPLRPEGLSLTTIIKKRSSANGKAPHLPLIFGIIPKKLSRR
jgi:hypothetical protein